MMRISFLFKLLVSTFTFCILCVGCDTKQDRGELLDNSNAVYYWRTTFALDRVERNFLRNNNVKRIYMRFFDIVVDKSPIAMDAVVPNATLQLKDTVQGIEIIPTIYITNDAMAKMASNEDLWAEKIVKRVYNMCSYNELETPLEMQLDCDWTAQTDSAFFSLCRSIKKQLYGRNPSTKLSATIRLHQLKQTPPPVDYGVLMLYNTGSFKNPDEDNSIISVDNIKPYLKYLSDYTLHLDFAYPIFSWKLVYFDGHFRGLLNTNNLIPSSILRPTAVNKYEVVKDTIINNTRLAQGAMIRHEEAPFKTIMEVKRLIEQHSRNNNSSVILYNLDYQNISNYTSDEFQKIYK